MDTRKEIQDALDEFTHGRKGIRRSFKIFYCSNKFFNENTYQKKKKKDFISMGFIL